MVVVGWGTPLEIDRIDYDAPCLFRAFIPCPDSKKEWTRAGGWMGKGIKIINGTKTHRRRHRRSFNDSSLREEWHRRRRCCCWLAGWIYRSFIAQKESKRRPLHRHIHTPPCLLTLCLGIGTENVAPLGWENVFFCTFLSSAERERNCWRQLCRVDRVCSRRSFMGCARSREGVGKGERLDRKG